MSFATLALAAFKGAGNFALAPRSGLAQRARRRTNRLSKSYRRGFFVAFFVRSGDFRSGLAPDRLMGRKRRGTSSTSCRYNSRRSS
jgi:hypothetical protein